MSKNDTISNSEIYYLCLAIYNYEKLFDNYVKDKIYQGNIIELSQFEKLKKKLDYERLKPLIVNDEYYTNILKQIKKKEKIKPISLKQYNNSNELLNELNNKKLIVLNQDLLMKINKEIKVKIIKFTLDKQRITIIFNDEDKLNFINNKDGIIESSSLIKDNLNIDFNSPKNQSGPNNNNRNMKIIFNKDIEILIRIFYYNKYLKEKENEQFYELKKDENSETIYLINHSWMEEYKSHFDYSSLEDYLLKNYEDCDYLSNSKINSIIESLPIEYINKINKSGGFDKNKTFNYEKKELNNKSKINFTYNNHIINSKTSELLISLNYKLNSYIRKVELFFIGNKKILLLFSDKDYKDQIGFINNKNIFIPEFLLVYNQNNISHEILNKFFKNDFFDFVSEKSKDEFEIKINKEKHFGHCYKIKDVPRNDENLNSSNNIKNDNPINFSDNSPLNSSNEMNGKNNRHIQKMNPYIELMINIYIFQEDLNERLKRNLTQSNDESRYIINKKWMTKFKSYFGYDNFLNYIKTTENINKTTKKHKSTDNNNEFAMEIIKLIPTGFLNNINEISQNKEKTKKLYNSEYSTIKIKEKKNLYYLYEEIEIINEKIQNMIRELFQVKFEDKKKFLFGDKKIIMDFNIMPQSSIIIGNFNKNYFESNILLTFTSKFESEKFFKKFYSEKYESIEAKYLNFGNNKEIILKTNSNIIGRAFKIYELENDISNINENGNNNVSTTNETIQISISLKDNNNQNNIKQLQNQQNIKINKIKLPYFKEYQIKALIAFYYFNEDLKIKIKKSEDTTKTYITDSECYIIDENWMKNYKKIFLYDELVKQIDNILKKSEGNINNGYEVENIYAKLENEYLNKIKEIGKKENENETKECKSLLLAISLISGETFFESPKIEDISKYKSFKFNIFNANTYKYMNKSSEKILTDIKIKEYLINEGRIYIKLANNIIKKSEILIASFIYESILFVPELLFKYKDNISMGDDFEYLKQYDYKKFKKERISISGNELIRKNQNNKVGIIYDLINPIINNQPSIDYIKKVQMNKQKISDSQMFMKRKNENDYNPQNLLDSEGVNNNENIKMTKEKKNLNSSVKIKNVNSLGVSDLKNQLIKDNNGINHFEENKNHDSKNRNGKNNKIANSYNENYKKQKQIIMPEIKLDETKKLYIEFLIRLFTFGKKLSIKIKNSTKSCDAIEQGYIINYKLIEMYKIWFKSDILKNRLSQDTIHKNIYNKYINEQGYISENKIDEFLKEVMKFLPKEYIKEIYEINISSFLYELQKKELYLLDTVKKGYYSYFSNCRIINFKLGQYLLYGIQKTDYAKIFSKYFINFIIAHNKVIIKFNNYIYIANIDNSKIFICEIMILSSSETECNQIFENFKAITIDDFIKLTKRSDKNVSNIGKYNNTNNIVVILNENYSIPNEELPPTNENISQYEDNSYSNINFSDNKGGDLNKNKMHNINMKTHINSDISDNAQKKEINKDNKKENIIKPEMIDNFEKKELVNIMKIKIDLIKIKMKIKENIKKDSKYEIYYPINCEWLKTYLSLTNLQGIYNNQEINNTIEYIIKNSQKNVTNNEIISNLKMQSNIKMIINNNPINNQINYNLLNQISIRPKKININDFYYYNNFILVNENTMKALSYNNTNNNFYYCYFGENRIFIVFNNHNFPFLIEVYYVDNNFNIIPEIFYQFYGENQLINSFNNLKDKGYSDYTKYSLIFINQDNNIDYASPIMDSDNKEIGYAYKYNPQINDYSPYIINKQYKAILKLYFYEMSLLTKSINKEDKKYYLMNKEYIQKYKEHYEYYNLEKMFVNNQFFLQVLNMIRQGNNNMNQNLNDKTLTLMIKNAPFAFNKNFIQKSNIYVNTNNISEEPKINHFQNMEIFYYDEFELIDENIYKSLFKNNTEGICRILKIIQKEYVEFAIL